MNSIRVIYLERGGGGAPFFYPLRVEADEETNHDGNCGIR